MVELKRSRSGLVHRPLPRDDPREREPDITKALLDWQPTLPLREGLIRTIACFDGLLSEGR